MLLGAVVDGLRYKSKAITGILLSVQSGCLKLTFVSNTGNTNSNGDFFNILCTLILDDQLCCAQNVQNTTSQKRHFRNLIC